jgi:hypothetical protein
MQVIERLTVISNPNRIFEIGTELNGREVIEIKQVGTEFENSIHSEFEVLDENGELIASIENAPVILDWITIVEDGPAPKQTEECFYCEEHYGTETRFGKPCCQHCKKHELRSSAPLHTMNDEQKANHLKMGMNAFKLAFGKNKK